MKKSTFQTNTDPIMVFGTCSSAGKSLMTTAICRSLLRKGESPLPFKGQNMSNNAWVDSNNGEMAYSQAVQAWAAGVDPICAMNPVLLKPQGDCTSEVIHLGKSVGIAKAATYYEDWFASGWKSIKKGLKQLNSINNKSRLIIEGAGSPVEVNLKHRDLTNLKLAKYLKAKCILVADIERGGVFAQLIGTLALMKPKERKLIKGIIINRFRGDISLFDKGRQWIEEKSKIPVLGVMPWLDDIFPPEDSLDLLERNTKKLNAELEIVVIKLPSLSNFSDIDPLEAESSVMVRWVTTKDSLGSPHAVVIPGSKQTIKDLEHLQNSGLAKEIMDYANSGGHVLGICGGLQMLGKVLEDPLGLENIKYRNSSNIVEGLGLLPIKTIFEPNKSLKKKNILSIWPCKTNIEGFELHHGKSIVISSGTEKPTNLHSESDLGWISNPNSKLTVAGTYLHGIFDNGIWRRSWLNYLRKEIGLKELKITEENHSERRDKTINLLTDSFEKHINLELLIN